MPENFPQSLKAVYPIVYNYSYLLAEGHHYRNCAEDPGSQQGPGTGGQKRGAVSQGV